MSQPKRLPKKERWRELDTVSRWQFIEDVRHGIAKRQEFGHDSYGDVFEGEPLQHAWEENLDALFYIWVAMQRQGLRPSA